MKRKLALGCFILAMTGQVAHADQLTDCRQARSPDARLRACNEIIDSQNVGPGDKSIAYVSRGNLRTNAGADQLASADYTEAIRLKKDNLAAYVGRARSQLTLGNRNGAIVDYSAAIRLAPSNDQIYVERGHAYTVSNNFDAGITDLSEAIRLNPRNWSALNDRGIAYAKKGDFGRAEEDYTKAIAIVPLPIIYANRGFAYDSDSKRDLAIKDLRQALLGDRTMAVVAAALKRMGVVDPDIDETERNIHAGSVLAEQNCSGCHAVGTTGNSPNKDAIEFRIYSEKNPLLTLRQPIVQAVFSTHERMPNFKAVSTQQLNSIVAYISSLSPIQ